MVYDVVDLKPDVVVVLWVIVVYDVVVVGIHMKLCLVKVDFGAMSCK